MRNERLLDAVGRIDECYISEAAPETEEFKVRETEMKRKNISTFFKRPMAAAAVLMLCVCLMGMTVLAATGELQGYFRDIIGWNGAVVGTEYEQASDEIELNVAATGDSLTVEMVMLYPDRIPYREIEELGIHSCKILDAEGKVISEIAESEKAKIADGRTAVMISTEGVPAGEYTLAVSAISGGKKADQDIVLSGSWKCEFTK